ncbi:patatin-like phospholipase family protein, partial [Methylicorpusculum sp.]|uniref:patatin-like phospholipase family protein n=1 Tax=Methylicorpusculum sp. TaxID=2713644 RepID=UPI002ABBDB3C
MATTTPNNNADLKRTFTEVKQEELKSIQKLRILNEEETPKNLDEIPENLVGLAFSGGGIRSATFGLGVLEALKDKGLLTKIDYLSTVSGGGYIGAWLSANCKRTADRIKEQKLEIDAKIESGWLHPNSDWRESIQHLRRYSNYLSPNLSLLSADTWSIATIWLRNTLLVQLMIIFTITSLLLVPRILFNLFKIDYE